MSIFQNSKQFYECVGELMDRAKQDPKIGPKIAKSGIVIQFRYTCPDAVTTVNARSQPTQPGAFVDVLHGPCKLAPDVTMTMKADVSHAFWHGKVNLLGAIAKRDIVLTHAGEADRLPVLPDFADVAVARAVGFLPSADEVVH